MNAVGDTRLRLRRGLDDALHNAGCCCVFAWGKEICWEIACFRVPSAHGKTYSSKAISQSFVAEVAATVEESFYEQTRVQYKHLTVESSFSRSVIA